MKSKLTFPYETTCSICHVTYKTMRPNETAHPQCLRKLARQERDKLCEEYSAKHFGALNPQLTEDYIYAALVRALKLVNHKEDDLHG